MFDDADSYDEKPGRKTHEQSDTDINANNVSNNNFHFPKLVGAQSSKSNHENLTQFNPMSPYLGNSNSS